MRKNQLFREDLRDLTKIQDYAQMEILAELLQSGAGQLMTYSSLANKINVSVDTVRRWIRVLKSFYYCFTIQPWTKNVTRSLLKEPKVFLWDWSFGDRGSRGARGETSLPRTSTKQFTTGQIGGSENTASTFSGTKKKGKSTSSSRRTKSRGSSWR